MPHEMIDAPHHRNNDQHDGDKTDTPGVTACRGISGCLFKTCCECFGDIDFAHGYFLIKSSDNGLIVLGSIAGLLM